MANGTATKAQVTRAGLLEAARQELRDKGYAGLTTRGVAGVAGVPMSQIQYHFGSKDGMVLALYEYMNAQLLKRQTAMFSDPGLTLSEQWDRACDYLDDDLASGYVGVLHELLAAGWTNAGIGQAVREGLMGWTKILNDLARKAEDTFGSLGPFKPDDIAALVSAAFIGAEALHLLGLEDQGMPLRRSLRRFGDVIRVFEQQGKQGES